MKECSMFDILPNDIQHVIYKMTHQLQFAPCLNEIKQTSYYELLRRQQQDIFYEHSCLWHILNRKTVNRYNLYWDVIDEGKKDLVLIMNDIRINDFKNVVELAKERFDKYRWVGLYDKNKNYFAVYK